MKRTRKVASLAALTLLMASSVTGTFTSSPVSADDKVPVAGPITTNPDYLKPVTESSGNALVEDRPIAAGDQVTWSIVNTPGNQSLVESIWDELPPEFEFNPNSADAIHFFEINNDGTWGKNIDDKFENIKISKRKITADVKEEHKTDFFFVGSQTNSRFGYTITSRVIVDIEPGSTFVNNEGMIMDDGEEVTDSAKVHTPKPSLDIEKTWKKLPEAMDKGNKLPVNGNGNFKDPADNVGEVDADTEETAHVVVEGERVEIAYKLTNNSKEAVTKIVLTDELLAGASNTKVNPADIIWTFEGKTFSVDRESLVIEDDKGKAVKLPAGKSMYGVTQIEGLEEGAQHVNKATVGGIGVDSAREVGDSDELFLKTPDAGIDVEKTYGSYGNAGNGNMTDVDDNAGSNDADTEGTAIEVVPGKAGSIKMLITNKDQEGLTNIKLVDKITGGKAKVTDFKANFEGKTLTLAEDSLIMDGENVFVLPVGKQVQVEAKVDALENGDTHSNEVLVTAQGEDSGKEVSDKDQLYLTTPAAPKPTTENPDKPQLPNTGGVANIFLPDTPGEIAMSGVSLAGLAGLGYMGYRKFFKKAKQK